MTQRIPNPQNVSYVLTSTYTGGCGCHYYGDTCARLAGKGGNAYETHNYVVDRSRRDGSDAGSYGSPGVCTRRRCQQWRRWQLRLVQRSTCHLRAGGWKFKDKTNLAPLNEGKRQPEWRIVEVWAA